MKSQYSLLYCLLRLRFVSVIFTIGLKMGWCRDSIELDCKFIGTKECREHSIGYINGEYYKINVWAMKSIIKIMRADTSGLCLYESEKSFSQNWQCKNIIRKLKLNRINFDLAHPHHNF